MNFRCNQHGSFSSPFKSLCSPIYHSIITHGPYLQSESTRFFLLRNYKTYQSEYFFFHRAALLWGEGDFIFAQHCVKHAGSSRSIGRIHRCVARAPMIFNLSDRLNPITYLAGHRSPAIAGRGAPSESRTQ